MGKFKLEDYSPVDERLVLFRSDNPDGRIITDVVEYSETNKVVIKASLFKNKEEQKDSLILATGIAEETPEGYVNATSRVENCETSAIGRALANAGYSGSKNRPSREEMKKVERLSSPKDDTPSSAKSSTPEPSAVKTEATSDAGLESEFEKELKVTNSKIELTKLYGKYYQMFHKMGGDESSKFREKYFAQIQEKIVSATD